MSTVSTIETESMELIPPISEKELFPERVSDLTYYFKNSFSDKNWLYCKSTFRVERTPQTKKFYLQILDFP